MSGFAPPAVTAENRGMDVTILIRARNEEQLFGRCLEMIFTQDTTFRFEVLLIDSGSTDRTLEIARSFPQVRIHEIPPEEFNYGETLNLGVRLSLGRFVVPLSAHCVPVNAYWLQALVAPLERDPHLAASFSRQIAWPGCEPVERYGIETTFGSEAFLQEQVEVVNEAKMSNASSCIRRDVALAVPFRDLAYGEDRCWAVDVFSVGYRIAYVPESVVWHSHARTVGGYYRLGVITGIARAQLGLQDDARSILPLLRPDRLYSRFSKWSRICRCFGFGVVRSRVMGMSCMIKSMARLIGKWRGEHAYAATTGGRMSKSSYGLGTVESRAAGSVN